VGVRVKGAWKYLYRAVDKAGATVDFLLTARRDRKALIWVLMGPDRGFAVESRERSLLVDQPQACQILLVQLPQSYYSSFRSQK
jgi:transposase-like protein